MGEVVGPASLREGGVGLGEALVGVKLWVPRDSVTETVRCEPDREPVVKLVDQVRVQERLPVSWPDPVPLCDGDRVVVRLREDPV